MAIFDDVIFFVFGCVRWQWHIRCFDQRKPNSEVDKPLSSQGKFKSIPELVTGTGYSIAYIASNLKRF